MLQNDLIESLDFLLDKEWVEKFFSEESEKIFGQKSEVKVLEIKRTLTLAPESYAIFFSLMVDGTPVGLRSSASTRDSREKVFDALKYVYDHGFDKGEIIVPRPCAYFKEYNLMLYRDVPGRPFINELNRDYQVLENKVKMAAKALAKLHGIDQPQFDLPAPIWQITKENIAKFFPEIATELVDVAEKAKNAVGENKIFCHGDYQPNNLLINDEHLCVIDFGAATFAEKELDIASFITQLEIMMQRFGNLDHFDKLSQVFLEEYGSFDENKFNIYNFLYSAQILETMILFFRKEEERKALEFWKVRVMEKMAKF